MFISNDEWDFVHRFIDFNHSIHLLEKLKKCLLFSARYLKEVLRTQTNSKLDFEGDS